MATTRQRIQLRRDTAAAWSSANPILLAGEVGHETDTNKLKIGNGSSNWNALPYVSTGAGGSSTLSALTDVSTVNAIDGSILVYQSGEWIGGTAVTVLEVANGGNF